MAEIELSAGTIEYEDTGGEGPAVVLLHGLVMNGSLWRNVVPKLSPERRCIVPTLPLGGHRLPMRPDADLSMRGQAGLVAELLERLDLRDATLVMSDWGGALLYASGEGSDRLGRLALVSCEAFDNVPPGLPGTVAWLAAKAPGGVNAALQPLRLRPLRRLPIAFGWMAKRPIPNDVMDDWLRPALTNRRDPPRPRQVRGRRDGGQTGPARRHRAPAELRAAGARRVGQRGSGDAAGARAAAGGPAAPWRAGRGRGQLHPDSGGSARRAGGPPAEVRGG